jgi:hypothetical protein
MTPGPLRPAVLLALLVVPLAAPPSWAQSATILSGQCGQESHIAEGQIGEDLTQRQSRFFCNAAVMNTIPNRPGQALVQFTQREAHRVNILGFAGTLVPGDMMSVQRIYFTPSQPTTIQEGVCKFFYQGHRLTSIFCGGKVDEGQRRTVALVVFTAAPQ